MLQYIIWDASPEIFRIGWFALRWYGLLFALGFLFGYNIMARIFKWEGKPEKDLDRLFLFTIISTVVGARLGHVFFYEPADYLANPIKILMVWEGGLASHGAAVAILIGIYLYARSSKGQSFWWVMDRLVITVALGGALIRTGNLMNSEIIGKPFAGSYALAFTHSLDDALESSYPEIKFKYARKTAGAGKDTLIKGITYKPIQIDLYFQDKTSPEVATQFTQTQVQYLINQGSEVQKHYSTLGKPLKIKTIEDKNYTIIRTDAYTIPRHAGQFYEGISCFLLFGFLFLLYKRQKERTPEGQLFGIFMIVCFGLRFFYEFLKENQVDFESKLTYNMGQLLSIPAILIGVVVLIISFMRKKTK